MSAVVASALQQHTPKITIAGTKNKLDSKFITFAVPFPTTMIFFLQY